MRVVPIGAQRKPVTQSEKHKYVVFALSSLYHYRNISESPRRTIPAYWLLLDSGDTVRISQDEPRGSQRLINVVMSIDLVLG